MELKASGDEIGSIRYLVLADEGADGEALLEKLRQVAAHRTGSDVHPPRPSEAGRALVYMDGGPEHRGGPAHCNGGAPVARARGLRVDETSVGDASPVQAIADILVQRGPFSGIIISTQPRRISRWLRLDVQTIARHRFSLPVISVIGQKAVAA